MPPAIMLPVLVPQHSRRQAAARAVGPWFSALALCVVATVISAWLPAAARACSCPAKAAIARWPANGADDVPTDTPIVISRYNLFGSTDAVGFALTDDEGREVALTEVNRLAAAYTGCGAAETVFLRPAVALDADVTYSLAIASDIDPNQLFGASFTTSNTTFVAEESAAADLDYLLVTSPACVGSDCPALAEATIALTAEPRVPRWLVVESAATENGRNTSVLEAANAASISTPQLSVLVPPGDRCIDVHLYGIEGVAIWEQRRCQPDRCARTDAETFSSCGGPPISGLRSSDIPSGSCNAPPTISQTASPRPVEENGCSVRRPARAAGGSWWLLLWLPPMAIRTRRRRLSRAPPPPSLPS